MRRRLTYSWSSALRAWLLSLARLLVSVGVPFVLMGFLLGDVESGLVGTALAFIVFGSFVTAAFILALLPTDWLGAVFGAAAGAWLLWRLGGDPAAMVVVGLFGAFMGWLVDAIASRIGPIEATKLTVTVGGGGGSGGSSSGGGSSGGGGASGSW